MSDNTAEKEDDDVKRVSIVLIVLVVVSALAVQDFAGASGNGRSGKVFRGLWEGIDPVDGSSQKILISGGADGVFSLVWRESYWTICDGRRGVLNGAGELDPDDRKTLAVQMTVTCFDPEEVVLEDTIAFELVGQNMLLASAPGAFTDLPFFRVSGRVRGGERDDDR